MSSGYSSFSLISTKVEIRSPGLQIKHRINRVKGSSPIKKMFIREISVESAQPLFVNLNEIPELTEDECFQVTSLLVTAFHVPKPVLPVPGQLFLLMEDNLVLAVAMISQAITQLPETYSGRIISNVVTHPMYRKYGLAYYLLINMLFQIGEPVYLLVKVDNTAAINLYRKLKFNHEQLLQHNTPNDPELVWLMKRS